MLVDDSVLLTIGVCSWLPLSNSCSQVVAYHWYSIQSWSVPSTLIPLLSSLPTLPSVLLTFSVAFSMTITVAKRFTAHVLFCSWKWWPLKDFFMLAFVTLLDAVDASVLALVLWRADTSKASQLIVRTAHTELLFRFIVESFLLRFMLHDMLT